MPLGALGAPAVAAADPGELVGIEIASVDVDADMVGDNGYGYWEYLPTAYDAIGEPWPMFIFLSGIGENGNGMLPPGGCTGPAHPGEYLCRNLRHGPQSHLWNNLYGAGNLSDWDDEERPFIVISPQNPAPLFVLGNPYEPADMDAFLDFLLAHYNVDPRRIYLTGMSMGGYSVTLHAVNNPGRYAAVSLLPGVGVNPGDRELPGPCDVGRTALWAFHGDNDGVQYFDPDDLARFVRDVADCPEPHPVAQLTMYQNAGHDVWTRTIDPPQGMAAAVYDGYALPNLSVVDTVPYDVDLYSWLLQYDLPDVSAGPDFEVTTDEDAFDITATIVDDDAVAFTWTQTAGTPLTLTNTDGQTLTVSDLAEGEYSFHVFALDADDQWDEDDVTITIGPGMGVESDSEGSSSSSTSGDDSSSTGGGIDTGDGPTTATASGSGSDSGDSASSDSASGSDSNTDSSASDSNSSASSDGGSDGADTDTDTDGGGQNSDGGCTTGGDAPSPWVLGLFGLVALRRRR